MPTKTNPTNTPDTSNETAVDESTTRASEFRSLPLPSALVDVVEELGFTKLTPIQARAIPLLLEGKDLVGQSKTGSGKTAAYTLPILAKLDVAERFVAALVLCPTRELCQQVGREIRKLGRRLPGLEVVIAAGGQPIAPQATALARGVHVVVATPGRAVDLLRRGVLDPSSVATLVLDEADRMLDMGFEDQVEEILKVVPKSRQTVFFSATYPNTIGSMSRTHQKQPVRVTIEDEPEAAPDIAQFVVMVEREKKNETLFAVLAGHAHESAIVFCNLKATASELETTLTSSGVSAAALHGDLEQRDRDRVMAKFRNGSTRVLLATDVAARGIDIDSVDLVVNYDLPSEIPVYVHRIGRTGRAGKAGLAIAFATSREKDRLQAIEQSAGVVLERTKIDTKRAGGRSASSSSANDSEHASAVTAASASASKVSASTASHGAKMETLRIAGGRKDKVRPGDILGALTGEAGGLDGTDVGKIEIHDHFAYVAVAKKVAKKALESLANGRIKGRKFRVSLVE